MTQPSELDHDAAGDLPERDGARSDADIAAQPSPLERSRRALYGVWTAIGAILLVGVFVYLLGILSIPVGIIVWTVIFVFCLRTPVAFFERKGINRTVGTTIAYVLMFIVLGLVGLLLFSPIFGVSNQFASLAASLPDYANQFIGWVEDMYQRYAHILQNDNVRAWIDAATGELSDWAGQVAAASASGVVAFGAGVANSLMTIGFALVVAFWVLMELPGIGRECRRLVGPKHREDAEMLHVTFTRVMGGYIKGTLLQCAIIGVACGVLFGVCDIPNCVALGAIAGIMNIIPIVGPWLGGILAAVVGAFVSPVVAIVAVVGTIAIQQFVYTFVSPRIMQSSVDVHPAVSMIALMVGSAIGGAMGGLPGSLVGMLVSIPAVAVAKSVFVYYFEKRTGRRLVAQDGVFFKGTPAEGDAPDPIADATSPHPGAAQGPSWKKRTGNNAHEVHDDR